jgi:hypothetical protein
MGVHQTRLLFETDIATLYRTAGCCDDSEIPALTALAKSVSKRDGNAVSSLDIVRWVCGRRHEFGKVAAILLGVDTARSRTYAARWRKAAPLLGYSSGDSFRNGKRKGRSIIDVVLGEITSELLRLAQEVDFERQAMAIADSRLQARIYCSLYVLKADRVTIRLGETMTLDYHVLHKSSWPAAVWLSAYLIDEDGVKCTDDGGDTLAKVTRGLRVYSRPFTISRQVSPGHYQLIGDLVHGESPFSDDAIRLPATLNKCGLTVEPKYVPPWLEKNPFYVASKDE